MRFRKAYDSDLVTIKGILRKCGVCQLLHCSFIYSPVIIVFLYRIDSFFVYFLFFLLRAPCGSPFRERDEPDVKALVRNPFGCEEATTH